MVTVKDLMTREVISFTESTSVDEMARTLADRHITGAPVVDGDGNVVGIVSEVDVFARKGRVARDIMSPHVIAVTEETGVEEAARILAGERIRRLPVLSAGRMVGLVSRSDVLDFFTHSHWTCEACGDTEHGLEQPERCEMCGASGFRLERAAPGS
ncbi:MAG: CBS domain-containing protein [Candidatus Dormibacterales bacterium]